MDEWLDGLMMDRWIDGWMNGGIDGWMVCHLVQGAHGEHGAIVSLDGLDECCVSPDVNIPVCGSGENQVLGSAVTR